MKLLYSIFGFLVGIGAGVVSIMMLASYYALFGILMQIRSVQALSPYFMFIACAIMLTCTSVGLGCGYSRGRALQNAGHGTARDLQRPIIYIIAIILFYACVVSYKTWSFKHEVVLNAEHAANSQALCDWVPSLAKGTEGSAALNGKTEMTLNVTVNGARTGRYNVSYIIADFNNNALYRKQEERNFDQYPVTLSFTVDAKEITQALYKKYGGAAGMPLDGVVELRPIASPGEEQFFQSPHLCNQRVFDDAPGSRFSFKTNVTGLSNKNEFLSFQ